MAAAAPATVTPPAYTIISADCKHFLSVLLKHASQKPQTVARHLIQGLIEGRVEPEVFATRLQWGLNSSDPRITPFLKKYVPFLKMTLPLLQHSLATRELTIDGVNPPSLSQVSVSISGQARIIPLPVTVSSSSPALSRETQTGPDHRWRQVGPRAGHSQDLNMKKC